VFESLMTWLRSRWRRLRRPEETAIVVRRAARLDRTTGLRSVPRRGGATDDARSTGIDPVDAAEIFAPSHGEEERYGFSRLDPDGSVPHRGELWDREHNSMRVRRRRVMLITCSGSVVPSGESITGVCSLCGGVDSVVHRCVRCGAALCQIHARVLQHPDGPAVYCPAHLEKALEDWDTWAAWDSEHGTKPTKSPFPGRPWAVAKYHSPTGDRHA
jgi:hypothetical protein